MNGLVDVEVQHLSFFPGLTDNGHFLARRVYEDVEFWKGNSDATTKVGIIETQVFH